MPLYTYEIKSSAGQISRDEGEFSSVAELFQTVHARGSTLISYRRKVLPAMPRFRSRLKRPLLAEFFHNLALLLKGGVPLREALDDMVKPPCHPALQEIFVKVRSRIDEGLLFSEALKGASSQIPDIMFPLIYIGEETGQLDRTLEDGAAHLERMEAIISSTRRALVYPAVILFSMIGALAFWMIFVLPKLMEMFETMGITDLPLATRILMAGIDISKTWWPVVPVTLTLALVFFILSRKNERLHLLWDQLWNHMPLFRTVIRSSQLAFFFEYTAMLSAAGVNILRTLELMEQSVSNQILKKGVTRLRGEIGAGRAMSEAITSLGFFDPFILRMVKVGEQTGNMPEQFKLLADFYMDKVDKLVSAMSKTLEPLIIAVAGLIFAIIALGLLGPVYNMISNLST